MAIQKVCISVGEGKVDEELFNELVYNVKGEIDVLLQVERDGDIVEVCGDIDNINTFKNIMQGRGEFNRNRASDLRETSEVYFDIVDKIEKGLASMYKNVSS